MRYGGGRYLILQPSFEKILRNCIEINEYNRFNQFIIEEIQIAKEESKWVTKLKNI